MPIERELLTIVFASQHFSIYLLARSFTVESDHKLLEMIVMKNLTNAPNCLQRMLLGVTEIQHDHQVQAWSYCPARASPEIKLDIRVIYIAFTKD